MIVLASRSPRRRQLLAMLGIEHEVVPADLTEELIDGEAAPAAARRIALAKARTVASERPEIPVLGADTMVVLAGRILGKPATEQEAREMLRALSGKPHDVVTAVAMVWPGGQSVLHDITRVEFTTLSDDTIAGYVATGEPMDKAGAYGIQGLGAALIERIEGDYFSVMGLPLRLVVRLMEESGEPYRFTR